MLRAKIPAASGRAVPARPPALPVAYPAAVDRLLDSGEQGSPAEAHPLDPPQGQDQDQGPAVRQVSLVASGCRVDQEAALDRGASAAAARA
jgi:hypothetical protein